MIQYIYIVLYRMGTNEEMPFERARLKEMFAGLMEQKSRFDDITWPTLKTAVMQEGGDILDKTVPSFYRCDGIHSSLPYENAYKMGSLLQTQSLEAQARYGKTFATSKALDQATWLKNSAACWLKAAGACECFVVPL